MKSINISVCDIPVLEYDAIVVGSGAAGYNAADTLYSLGKKNIALITEGRMMGTSRNTGSDKQTYYKLQSSGDVPDSVYDMAKSLYDGGAMNGDTALIEAAYSQRCFYKLVNLGVPFPYNEYGEFVGYRTDHDERRRATSCGPLTSKYMTEALERAVLSKNIPVLNGHRVIKILTDGNRAVGVITQREKSAIDGDPLGLCIILAGDIIYAVGGPSAIYQNSVYPESQTCALGAAFEAGAEGASLTESQYGIASTKFRWNLSGTYQQVVPRYVSVGDDGESEFLPEYFGSVKAALDATFMKGYQWPFDPRKVDVGTRSSLVDIAVYTEIKNGRKVYLDFTKNPAGFDFSLLSDEARTYLENSGATFGTPIERLEKMNSRAVKLYRDNGIDLHTELLEIAVCAQHNNGGLAITADYESTTLSRFYPVGECAGVFGVYRPGGSALNSTQVSSTRAAQKIAKESVGIIDVSEIAPQATEFADALTAMLGGGMDTAQVLSRRGEYGKVMFGAGAFLRSEGDVLSAISYFERELSCFYENYRVSDTRALMQALINRDIIITSLTYLGAIRDYIADGGKSRGSYLVGGSTEIDTEHFDKVQYTSYKDGKTRSRFEMRRKIPESEQWFETVYNKFGK
ncbi:MAG: FAD-binding protein [Clostridia bacterium]|nr:FAD-binding protein [Clostridia bacterium]